MIHFFYFFAAQMWSGRLKIPNFLRGESTSYGDNRVVKGNTLQKKFLCIVKISLYQKKYIFI